MTTISVCNENISIITYLYGTFSMKYSNVLLQHTHKGYNNESLRQYFKV